MFKIPVKIESFERRKRSTGLLHIIAGFYLLAMGSVLFRKLGYARFGLLLPLFLAASFSFIYGAFFKRLDPNAAYNRWIRLLQGAIFLTLGVIFYFFDSSANTLSLFLWTLVSVLLVFTEGRLFTPKCIELLTAGIRVPGAVKDHLLPWALVEDFVARTDYVTIFRRDKKYVQLEVADGLAENELEAINLFSKQQIAAFAGAEESL